MTNVYAFGRMNPPTIGHRKLVNTIKREARKANAKPRLFLSKSVGVDNPLSPEEKLSIARRLFPDIQIDLARDPFDASRQLEDTDAILIVGEDRREKMSNLRKYLGTEFLGLNSLEIITIPRSKRAASASRARKAAVKGNYEAFRKLMPTKDEELVKTIYETVRLKINGGDNDSKGAV